MVWIPRAAGAKGRGQRGGINHLQDSLHWLRECFRWGRGAGTHVSGGAYARQTGLTVIWKRVGSPTNGHLELVNPTLSMLKNG